jgi:hypothetical protein
MLFGIVDCILASSPDDGTRKRADGRPLTRIAGDRADCGASGSAARSTPHRATLVRRRRRRRGRR